MSQDDGHDSTTSRGLVYLFVLVVLTVSLVGFLTGTSSKQEPLRGHPGHSPPATPVDRGSVPAARGYLEMRNSPPGSGSGWQQSLEVAAAAPTPRLTQETLDQALRKRQQRRAYDGAPPTIPHHVRSNSVAECMACHDQGLRLGSLRAGAIPHDNFTNCTQCHVADAEGLGGLTGERPPVGKDGLPRDPRDVPNSFQGTYPKKHGDRAWPIAPPEIPHSTFMRESCMSCHGPNGSSALRTSHDQRQSCTQCHTPSAALDLRPGAVPPPPAAP